MRPRDGVLSFRLELINTNFSAATLEGDQLSVRRKVRRVVAGLIASNLRLRVGGKVVEKQMSRAVAIRNVNQPAAVGGPGDLRFFGRIEGHARGVAAICARSGKDFAAHDERDLLAVGREGDF